MPARFSLAQTTGAAPGVRDSVLGSFGELFAFSSDDSFGALKPAIQRGGRSYEVWLQLCFPELFDTVHDVWLWLALPSNESVQWFDATLRMGCAQTYRAPLSTASDIATTPVPTDDRGARNVTIGGSVAGALQPGLHRYTDFIVLQLSVEPHAALGFLKEAKVMATYLEGSASYGGI